MEIDINWPLSSVIYQIYPRSFQDTNGDGIGDIPGIISRLDYLKELGISAIWLSPIYTSPQADFGYDVADYTNIDSTFGTLEDFSSLVEGAHKRGIKIMMDYVPNHTSSEHNWFKESRSSKNNLYRDYYIWANAKPDGSPPNNWLSVFGGSAWERDQKTGQYYLHTFDKHQPDLNWRNPKVVEEMLNVLRFWMDQGVDGFRVDVPYHMFKDPNLQDEPPSPNYISGTHSEYESLLHIHTSWLHESFEMMKKFVDVLKEYKEKFMVTEAWGSMQDLIKLYVTVGWKWYQPFNFSLMTLPWKAEPHKTYIDEYDKALGDLYLPCWVLGNHDRPRVASRIGEKQARIAAMLQLTLRGLPFIYYGEELGMTDTLIPPELVQDTFEKNSPGLGLGRDPQRTPMQWNAEKNAGFTTDKPWLPVNENYKEKNAEKEIKNEQSMFTLYQRLIQLDQDNTAIREGSYSPLPIPAENVLAFIREKDNEKVLVILNFDKNEKKISMDFKDAKVICNASLTSQKGEKIDLSDFLLKGDEGYILSI